MRHEVEGVEGRKLTVGDALAEQDANQLMSTLGYTVVLLAVPMLYISAVLLTLLYLV